MPKDIERRIKKLEAKLKAKLLKEKITLYFEDGSATEIQDRGDLMIKLFHAASSEEELSAEEAELLDLISRASAAYEPGGGHIFDLVKCALHAEAKEMNRRLAASRNDTIEGEAPTEQQRQPRV